MAYLYNAKIGFSICLVAVLTACGRTDYAPYEVGLPENVIPMNSSQEVITGPRAANDDSLQHGGGILAAQTGNSTENKSDINVEAVEALGGRNIDDIDSEGESAQGEKTSSDSSAIAGGVWNVQNPLTTALPDPTKALSDPTSAATSAAAGSTPKALPAVAPIPTSQKAENKKKSEDKKAVITNQEKEKAKSEKPKTVRPVEGKIVSKFGTNDEDGIEFSANLGQKVVAFKNGTVKYRGNNKDWGNLIIIKHDGDLMSVYAYLKDMVVNTGDAVKAGQKIGTVGKSIEDNSSPRLYFQILKDDVPIDPEKYF